jgi:hypothetical protein
MPLWNLHCNENAYSTEDKMSFAEAITGIYASGGDASILCLSRLPRDTAASLFIGGVARDNFVRISIDHIARSTLPEDRQKMLNFLNTHIDPFVKDRGFEWELHVDETPRDLWTVQGMFPPPSGSEEEQRRARENRPRERNG